MTDAEPAGVMAVETMLVPAGWVCSTPRDGFVVHETREHAHPGDICVYAQMPRPVDGRIPELDALFLQHNYPQAILERWREQIEHEAAP